MSAAEGRPVLGVSVAAFRGAELLLVRRGKAPFEGLWSLPGGSVESGEPLREAARREVLEETGLAVEVGRLVDFHEVIERGEGGRHVVIAVFRADTAGAPTAGDDAQDARFVSLDELARLETTPGLPEIARRALAG